MSDEDELDLDRLSQKPCFGENHGEGKYTMDSAVGVVGLGVMGHNLALNIGRHSFSVVAYDINPEKIGLLLEGAGRGKNIAGVGSASALVAALNKPRIILVMVPAGNAVDSAISQLKPHLASGDILIDGGNPFFQDTERRNRELEAIAPVFRAIAARAEDGQPCVEYMGRAARATMSKWCTTASSTGTCS
jgi:6-phosphogluconate dehydrogenase